MRWGFGVIVEGEGSTANFNGNNVMMKMTQSDYSSQTFTVGAGSVSKFNNAGDVVIESYSPYSVTAVSGYGDLTFNNTGNVLLKAEILPGYTTASANVVGIQGSKKAKWTVTESVNEFKIDLKGAGVDNDGTSYSTGTKGISAWGDEMTIAINAKNFVINMDIASDVVDDTPEGHTAEKAYGISIDTGTKLTIGSGTVTNIKIREGLGTAYGIYAGFGATATIEGNVVIDVEGKQESCSRRRRPT